MKFLINLIFIFSFLFPSLSFGEVKFCLSDHIFKDFKSYGESFENAIQLAMEDEKVNVKIEKYYFDQSPQNAIETYKKMLANNCQGIIGFSYLSDLVVLNEALKLNPNVPIISPFGAIYSKKLQDSIKLLQPSQEKLVDKLVSFLKKKYPQIKSYIVITDLRRLSMIEYRDALKESLKKNQIEGQFFDSINDDLKTGVPSSKDTLSILLTGTTQAAKVIEKNDYQGIYVGVETFGSKFSPSLMNLLNKDKKSTTYAIRNIAHGDESKERAGFYEKYYKRFMSNATILSVYAYDALKLMSALKLKNKASFTGISGVQLKEGVIESSNFYSIISPSNNYVILEKGVLK